MKDKLIYLYIKESPLGLKYLGQTTKDPFKYKGSGKWWKRHIKNHKLTSSDIKTTILLKTYSREEIKEWGIYYSLLWNIVESQEWANLIPESGEHSTLGYKHTPENVEKIRLRGLGRKQTEENKKKFGEKIREWNRVNGKTEKQIESVINIWKGKKLPQYIIDAFTEANSIKVINKQTGEIYSSIQVLADKLGQCRSIVRYRLNNDINYEYKYLDENLNNEVLKTVQKKEDALNYRKPKNIKKSSKYTGVYWDKNKKKWTSMIRSFETGKKVFLGRFDIEEDARDAYQNYINLNKKNKGYIKRKTKLDNNKTKENDTTN